MNFFTHAVLWCFALVLATDVVAQAEGENCWSSLPLRFPAGEATSVIQRTFDFLVKVEAVPVHPYWPEGASGVTIGVGWDLGQHDSDQLAKAWSALPVQRPLERARTAGTGRYAKLDIASPSLMRAVPASLRSSLPSLRNTLFLGPLPPE